MEENRKQGIQSIEVGVMILQFVAAAERPITITELAELCETSKSKLYRYLNSFVRTGMLIKDQDSRYVLGSEILRLGLKASNDIKIVDIAQPYLMHLKEKFNETSGLAILGEEGPFFVSWEESAGPINIGIKVGSTIGITNSAIGKVFASYLSGTIIDKLILKELGEDTQAITEFKDNLQSIRENGYGYTVDTLIQGINAIATPIFDRNNILIGVISVVGLSNTFSLAPDSEIVMKLKEYSEKISRELGWGG